MNALINSLKTPLDARLYGKIALKQRYILRNNNNILANEKRIFSNRLKQNQITKAEYKAERNSNYATLKRKIKNKKNEFKRYIKNSYKQTNSINGKKIIKAIMNSQSENEVKNYYTRLGHKENNLMALPPSYYAKLAKNQANAKLALFGKASIPGMKVPANLSKNVMMKIMMAAGLPPKAYNHYKHYAYE